MFVTKRSRELAAVRWLTQINLPTQGVESIIPATKSNVLDYYKALKSMSLLLA